MIKALIFDCYGVLTTDGWAPFKQENFASDKNLFDEATSLNYQADAGFISYSDFIARLSEMSGKDPDYVRRRIEMSVANQAIFDYIGSLNNKYKIGMLSNVGADLLNKLFSPSQLEVFDAKGLSFDTGYVKPQSEAYLDIAEKLHVEPKECVFIDDSKDFCEAANSVGMQSVYYRDATQAISDLHKILANSKD